MKLSFFTLLLYLAFFCQGECQSKSIQMINNIDDVLVEDSTIFRILTASDSSIVYEIRDYKGLSGQIYSGLVISQNGHKLLTWIERKFDLQQDLDPIDRQRKKWVYTCNQNNSAELVNNFYFQDALYYNHKPLVKGSEDLINEYSYMNNLNYNLDLRPIIVELVSHDVVFEIGRCEGSYNGNYILIWKMNAKGEWLIAFDSNI